MKLKDIALMAALTTSPALPGCGQSAEPVTDKTNECDVLKQNFKDKVDQFRDFEGFPHGTCSENIKTYLEISDICKDLSTKCDLAVNVSSYDTVVKGLEYQLSRYSCIAKPEEKK